MQRAYDLRDRATEPERYSIAANYYTGVTGELDRANQVFEQWAQSYPRSDNAGNAVRLLQAASPCELGEPSPQVQIGGNLYPVYVRRQGSLENGDGQQAVAEFQKMLDHRGVVQNFILGALVHLQLGKAYLASGDAVRARVEYQDFLPLWKDADPDIPILKQAKTEYVKLPLFFAGLGLPIRMSAW